MQRAMQRGRNSSNRIAASKQAETLALTELISFFPNLRRFPDAKPAIEAVMISCGQENPSHLPSALFHILGYKGGCKRCINELRNR